MRISATDWTTSSANACFCWSCPRRSQKSTNRRHTIQCTAALERKSPLTSILPETNSQGNPRQNSKPMGMCVLSVNTVCHRLYLELPSDPLFSPSNKAYRGQRRGLHVYEERNKICTMLRFTACISQSCDILENPFLPWRLVGAPHRKQRLS